MLSRLKSGLTSSMWYWIISEVRSFQSDPNPPVAALHILLFNNNYFWTWAELSHAYLEQGKNSNMKVEPVF